MKRNLLEEPQTCHACVNASSTSVIFNLYIDSHLVDYLLSFKENASRHIAAIKSILLFLKGNKFAFFSNQCGLRLGLAYRREGRMKTTVIS